MPAILPPHAHSLDAALAEAMGMLLHAVTDRRSAFNTPTLATIALDGAPAARTVVLRGFDPASRTLRLHSDARAAKAAELLREPRCALHFYDAGAQVQLRLGAVARVHRDDALADDAWSGSRAFSRMWYAVEPGPGAVLPAPLQAPQDPDAGRDNFATLRLAFHSLEWLWLSVEGHRRARFTWRDGEVPDATWLVP